MIARQGGRDFEVASGHPKHRSAPRGPLLRNVSRITAGSIDCQAGPLPAQHLAVRIDLQAARAIPRNSPCSTTPEMAFTAAASWNGSSIGPVAQSRMMPPLSVTQGRAGSSSSRPRLGSNANARQPLCRLRPAEGDDLDRQRRARAELIDALFGGRHQHVVVAGEGDELLAQQRAAAALDGVERGIDLVGAIDAEVEALDRRRGWSAECPDRGPALRCGRRSGPGEISPSATRRPSSRMTASAVEPVPRPTSMPGATRSAAATASRRRRSASSTSGVSTTELAAASSSTSQQSLLSGRAGRINCAGKVAGSSGPSSTASSVSALPGPPTRKRISRPALSTGAVRVSRVASSFGT